MQEICCRALNALGGCPGKLAGPGQCYCQGMGFAISSGPQESQGHLSVPAVQQLARAPPEMKAVWVVLLDVFGKCCDQERESEEW